MNENIKSVSAPTRERSTIEHELENLQIKLNSIEKSIFNAIDNFKRLDNPANRLNPDDYFRNQPQCENECDGRKGGVDPSNHAPITRSGQILKINELAAFAEQLDKRICSFVGDDIIPTAYFFDRNL